MLKFTAIETVKIDASNAESVKRASISGPVFDFAKLLLEYAVTGTEVQEYIYIEAGNVLNEGGLIAVINETLSMNDDHDLTDDVEYFHRTCGTGEYSYALLHLYRDGVLNLLYFIHE